MIRLLELLFWITVALIGFTYIPFPAIIFVRGRLVRKNHIDRPTLHRRSRW
ncbi:MAG: hypothetical protein U0Z44_06565 [Kouleothrix sp.]